NLCQGRAFIEAWAVYAGYDDVTVGQIVMACDEAASNVFRHGYAERPGPLVVQARVDSQNFFVWMVDEATPVDSSKIKPRDLADVRPGGLGTFIMNQVFDEVIYEPRAHGTVLKLRKACP
ncbi:MAG TPA: ATP-binding protein, partial [Verrucomicrobiae bacterium]|nr:ATP-binding protein [Verrucomicrobiae bacterium]